MWKQFKVYFAMLLWLPLMSGLAGAEQAVQTTAEAGHGGGAAAFKNPTHEWNEVWHEMLWDLWIIGGIFAVVAVWLLIRYRARSPDDVGTAPPLNLDKALAWSLVPAALFMADDFLLAAKGWSLWNVQRQVPPGAMEVKVTGYQWYFEYDYGNGIKDTQLTVPVGKPVVLRMTSNDVIHSFGLNEYRVKEDVMPGRITYIWFVADTPKETPVVCVEFCGNSHSEMTNPVKAVAQADFDTWMNDKLAKKKAELEKSKTASTATVTSPEAR
jgi:cytochrome c oxidase subunit 2